MGQKRSLVSLAAQRLLSGVYQPLATQRQWLLSAKIGRIDMEKVEFGGQLSEQD